MTTLLIGGRGRFVNTDARPLGTFEINREIKIHVYGKPLTSDSS